VLGELSGSDYNYPYPLERNAFDSHGSRVAGGPAHTELNFRTGVDRAREDRDMQPGTRLI
jgi:hypothetical protein